MWLRIALGIGVVFSAAQASAEESIQVTVVGKLQTGVVAIGGETTGTTITARDITWELEFGKNEELRKAANKWNGQQVTVTGSLERRAGIEVKHRWIVTVSSLQGPEPPMKKAAEQPERGAALPAIQPKSVREGTVVKVLQEEDQAGKDRVVLDIHCERGIDRCVIERTGEEWPTNLVVRLRLRGLESFQLHASNNTLEWSVPSSGEPISRCTLTSGKRVTQLSKDSPLFADVHILAPRGIDPRIPLAGGYFEIPLPPSFLEQNPTELTLQWVDFYR